MYELERRNINQSTNAFKEDSAMRDYYNMPPVSNVPSTDDDNDVAFKVLNNDNLPMSIIGEAILKPFGRDAQKQKPNVLVYPTRRAPTQLEENKQKTFTKSNGYIDNAPDKGSYNLRKNYSNSHGNLNHCNSASKARIDELQNQTLEKTFTKTLDAKLKKLQKDEKHKGKKVEIQNRPMFVTTVKKGQFLMPPPEVANSFGLKIDDQMRRDAKKVYEYASKPRVLHKVNPTLKLGHKTRCEAAAKAAALIASSIAGVQPNQNDTKKDVNANIAKRLGDAPLPYANLMFEKRVARGSNFAMQRLDTQKWNPNFAHAKLLSQGEGESAAARAAQARRRSMARRKAQTAHLRGAQLRLSSPPPVTGRRHEKVETDNFLEELMNNPPVTDSCCQTDLFLDRPVSPFYVPAKTGADVATQIYPGDLFDFDMEVQPILEVLVGKTIEQALIEVLEEEELAALKEQQRRFLEVRAAEACEMQRLEERERRWQNERTRRMSEYEEGLDMQREMEERIAASVLMQGYMADLLPSVLEGLEEDGFLTDSIKQDLDESFMPWLMKEVTHEMHEMVSSRDVLTDIVREILETRAELYKALNESHDEAEEEVVPSKTDIHLVEHMKLKQEIANQNQGENEEDAKQV